MTSPRLKDGQATCRAIYASTRSFYEGIAPQMGAANCGFKILYGPPLVEPRILLIGYEPGGKEEDMIKGEHQEWPKGCEYVTAKWPLANKLREVFELEALKACVGVNAIFLRAGKDREYQKLNLKLRQHVERFCHARVEELIAALRPKQIVFIGLKTMGLFVYRGVDDIVSNKGRVLTRTGIAAGCPTLGIMHLSGCRISKADRLRIKDRLANFISN
jgi:hypothetical protein